MMLNPVSVPVSGLPPDLGHIVLDSTCLLSALLPILAVAAGSLVACLLRAVVHRRPTAPSAPKYLAVGRNP